MINIKKKRIKWSEKETEIIRKYYLNGGANEVIKYLVNRDKDSIINKANKLRIFTKKRLKQEGVDFSNLLFPNTFESAYVLGIIWGDGLVRYTEKGTYVVSLKIKKSDFNDIRDLFNQFNFYEYKPAKETWSQCTQALTGNKKLAFFLKENDYLNKSLVSPDKILSLIPKRYHYGFFRGWFDADGACNDLLKGKGRICIAGSYNQDWRVLEELLKTLNINYGICKNVNKKGHRSSYIHILQYNSILRFRDYIYKDNLEIGFKRKRDNFFNIKNPTKWGQVKL